MKRLFLVLAIAFSWNAAAEVKSLARVNVVDDTGRVRSTEEWRGAPTILVPMYARCPLACPRIIESMKKSVGQAETNPSTFRVVLFSFDPRDTVADLQRLRERHRVPLSWTIATAKREDIRVLMDSVDYRYAETNGLYAHPNLAIALTPNLEVAKPFFAIDSTGATVDDALSVARGRRDWLTQFGGIALAGLLFLCIVSAVYLAVLFGKRTTPSTRYS
jgi:cytochrome oxidase Cu insertion factor (SCO1/SenC/PrrC family)